MPPANTLLKTFSTPQILVLATVLTGIGSGIAGTLLAFMLHGIQHLAFGYSPEQLISTESFLQGVSASAPLRRVIALMVCGIIAGVGWWALSRYGEPLVSIVEAVKSKKIMPLKTTLVHIVLQISTIALGSPLGREVAPREAGSLFAHWLCDTLKINPKDSRVLLACGAGAGLAAVYNVPLGGAVFTLEVLLHTFDKRVVLMAFSTSVLAVLISWIGLGNVPLYHLAPFSMNNSLILWSLITGPIFGLTAFWFIEIAHYARKTALHDWRMIGVSFINFTCIGLMAVYFPALLGNGKSPVQLEFDNSAGIALSAILLLLRMLICWSSLKVGAQGGLLTPSLANGALLAVILGGLWSFFWPGLPWDAFAVIGATAFLAAAQKMPLTAIVLIFEFTGINRDFLVPLVLAVGGSAGMSAWCRRTFLTG